MGSVVVFRPGPEVGDDAVREAWLRLESLCRGGIGERRAEGFGRLAAGPPGDGSLRVLAAQEPAPPDEKSGDALPFDPDDPARVALRFLARRITLARAARKAARDAYDTRLPDHLLTRSQVARMRAILQPALLPGATAERISGTAAALVAHIEAQRERGPAIAPAYRELRLDGKPLLDYVQQRTGDGGSPAPEVRVGGETGFDEMEPPGTRFALLTLDHLLERIGKNIGKARGRR